MIYKIHWERDIFEDNPGLMAVEKFAKLESNQMKFVCLVCDPSPDNPVRTLPERQRRDKAIILAGYPLEDGKRVNKNGRDAVLGKKPTIEAAIEEFRRLHYNENEDILNTLNKQIEEIREYLKSDKGNDPKKLKVAIELGTKLPGLVEGKLKIEELLKVRYNQKPDFGPQGVGYEVAQQMEKEEGGEANLSTIDKVMAAMRK